MSIQLSPLPLLSTKKEANLASISIGPTVYTKGDLILLEVENRDSRDPSTILFPVNKFGVPFELLGDRGSTPAAGVREADTRNNKSTSDATPIPSLPLNYQSPPASTQPTSLPRSREQGNERDPFNIFSNEEQQSGPFIYVLSKIIDIVTTEGSVDFLVHRFDVPFVQEVG